MLLGNIDKKEGYTGRRAVKHGRVRTGQEREREAQGKKGDHWNEAEAMSKAKCGAYINLLSRRLT